VRLPFFLVLIGASLVQSCGLESYMPCCHRGTPDVSASLCHVHFAAAVCCLSCHLQHAAFPASSTGFNLFQIVGQSMQHAVPHSCASCFTASCVYLFRLLVSFHMHCVMRQLYALLSQRVF
jgi:hypothetical protein